MGSEEEHAETMKRIKDSGYEAILNCSLAFRNALNIFRIAECLFTLTFPGAANFHLYRWQFYCQLY
jgi:hypothetical protein